jgi:hypothetical protein
LGDAPAAARPANSEPFFQRWSRRKLDACQEPVTKAKGPLSPALTETDLAPIDFEALDFNSNYSRFMLPQTPDAARSKALRKLWASHPVFSQPDGLQDYAKDYTDAAARLSDAAHSAYRIGQGFMTDAELTAWAELAAGSKQARLSGGGEKKVVTGSTHGRLHPETVTETDHQCRSIDAGENSASDSVQPSGSVQNCTDPGEGDR